MTTVVPDVQPVLRLLPDASVEPAPVRVCHYCLDEFVPTRDPKSGDLWDTDSDDQFCCDTCFCSSPRCLRGHFPDQTCPVVRDSTEDDDIVAREEAAVYGDDPDALYDARVDTCLGDHE